MGGKRGSLTLVHHQQQQQQHNRKRRKLGHQKQRYGSASVAGKTIITTAGNRSSIITPSIVISGASFDDEDDVAGSNGAIGTSGRRFLILGLFVIFSASNAFQWIQYAIITNIISKYYNVSNILVNWTSVIYMAIYIPGILPAAWLQNQLGLRFSVITGCLLNTAGAWIKCASIFPDGFTITMIGQALVAAGNLFVLNLPPRIAAVWFGPKEISSATSFGVFGNQIGIALGFILPPLLFPANRSEGSPQVEQGLNIMFYSMAGVSTVLLILIAFLFKDKPSRPPSLAQALADQQMTDTGVSYPSIIKSLMTDKNFVLLFITYGLNVGVFYAISTILNQVIDLRFPGHEVEAGIMGLILTLTGVFGSVVCGLILDKTHAFKRTTLVVNSLSLMGMIAFSLALQLPVLWPLFFVSGIMGFFMTGYLPIGFEFAAEISYPNPEGASAGLLNASVQVCGIVFTFCSSAIVDSYGVLPACVLLTIALMMGTGLTAAVREDLKRQNASQRKPMTAISGLSPPISDPTVIQIL